MKETRVVMGAFVLEDSVGFVINITAINLKNALSRAFKARGYKVTPEHWAVLNCLWREDGQNQSQIAKKIAKDKTNLTRILDVMEKNGYIRRQKYEGDRRVYHIYLTEEGRKLKKELIPIAEQLVETSVRGLSAGEQEQIVQLLNLINRNVG